MKYCELFEAVDKLSNNPHIEDLRNPDWVDRYEPYTDEHLKILQKHGIIPHPKGRFLQAGKVHGAFLKNGKFAIFYYSHVGNSMGDLEVVLPYLDKNLDKTLQGDVLGILVEKNNILLSRDRSQDKSWSGNKNKYSNDLKNIAKALLARGISSKTNIWLGNWGAGFANAEKIGTITQILKKKEIPNKLVLYHGTSTYRLQFIKTDGLVPMEINDRVWNKGGSVKERPEHRDECIYLTASRPQAEYYAKKSTDVDRARFNIDKRYEAGVKIKNLERIMSSAQFVDGSTNGKYTEEEIDNFKKQIADLKKKYQTFYGKFEPVLLEITLTKSEYKNLMADDDYLQQNKKANPNDWINSLSQFGQVAYKGKIPTSRIKVLAIGKDANQISR